MSKISSNSNKAPFANFLHKTKEIVKDNLTKGIKSVKSAPSRVAKTAREVKNMALQGRSVSLSANKVATGAKNLIEGHDLPEDFKISEKDQKKLNKAFSQVKTKISGINADTDTAKLAKELTDLLGQFSSSKAKLQVATVAGEALRQLLKNAKTDKSSEVIAKLVEVQLKLAEDGIGRMMQSKRFEGLDGLLASLKGLLAKAQPQGESKPNISKEEIKQFKNKLSAFRNKIFSPSAGLGGVLTPKGKRLRPFGGILFQEELKGGAPLNARIKAHNQNNLTQDHPFLHGEEFGAKADKIQKSIDEIFSQENIEMDADFLNKNSKAMIDIVKGLAELGTASIGKAKELQDLGNIIFAMAFPDFYASCVLSVICAAMVVLATVVPLAFVALPIAGAALFGVLSVVLGLYSIHALLKNLKERKAIAQDEAMIDNFKRELEEIFEGLQPLMETAEAVSEVAEVKVA
jgi:hypothetical protein